jgi:alpha-L-fucosidase 2
MMALFPMDQITPESPYFEPAVNSLKLRGDEATGWSMGWKVNLWARALDGDHAHLILKNALRHSTDYGLNQYAGGVYYNLYDAHAPFQIDGNFGCCAGIAEMLLQSHTDTLQLLPAMPSTWEAKGHVHGLKAVGNFTVDQDWKQGKLTVVSVKSHAGQPLYIQYPGIASKTMRNSAGKKVKFKAKDANTIVVSKTKVGETYTIEM